MRGVENGTIDPAVLDRLVYGPGGGAADSLQPPKLFEASLKDSGNLEGPQEKTMARHAWKDINPMSLTPPHVPAHSLERQPTPRPRIPLFQWPWRHPHAVPTPCPSSEPTQPSSDKGAAGSQRKPISLCVERSVDAVVLIVMPYALSPPNTTPALLVNCPITLASASPLFQDNVLDPTVPPDSRPSWTKDVDFSSAPLLRGDHPLASTGRAPVRETVHGRWAAQRGLDGGTPYG